MHVPSSTSHVVGENTLLTRYVRPFILPAICISVGYQFVRCYVSYPTFYLNLSAYLAGHERLPFQLRVLPILFLRPLVHSNLVQRIALSRTGPLHNPDRLAFFIVSLISFSAICYFCFKLYRAVSLRRSLEFLLFPVLIFVLLWTYVLHIEANFSYPYDLPSLAFFTAGIYFIYQRQFLPLVLVMLVGTFNRETTLFLIGIYILDSASLTRTGPSARFRARFNRALIPWARVAFLSALWLSVKLLLAFTFRANDRSEDLNHIADNLLRVVTPKYWPLPSTSEVISSLFSWIFHSRLRPQRFANYLYVLAPWVLIMFFEGIIVETRIYGELSCYVAIAAVLLFEHYLETLIHPPTSTGQTHAAAGRQLPVSA